MSLNPIKESTLSLALPFVVWTLIFAHLDPADLGRFAEASHKCHQLIQRFNFLGKLENVCGFVKETFFVPLDQHRQKRVATITSKRLKGSLTFPEVAELHQLIPEWKGFEIPSHAGKRPLTNLNPNPMELYRACPEPPHCLRRNSFSHFFNTVPLVRNQLVTLIFANILNSFFKREVISLSEFRTCYLTLNKLAFSLLPKMVPLEYKALMVQDDQLKSLNPILSDNSEQTSNLVVEEAAWFIASLLKGKEISGAEDVCKKVIRQQLTKISPEKLGKMEKIIKTTFETLKPLYIACKTIDRRYKNLPG